MGYFSAADPVPGRELAAFVAAVERGSVQHAADGLGLTQSAVSKRIAALEQRAGAQLLVRGRMGVVPTELGAAAYPLAKGALAALTEVGAALSERRTGADVTLRLTASLTVGEFLLPGWLGSFRVERPDLRVVLEIANSAAVIDSLRAEQAEIGFVEGLGDYRQWRSLTIGHDKLMIVVSAQHRWAKRRSLRPAELSSESYLTRERSSGTREVADAALVSAGVELKPALQAASLESLKHAVQDGGFTILSELAIAAETHAGTLIGLPLKDASLARELRALAPRTQMSEAGEAFWNWLKRLRDTEEQLDR